MAFGIPTGSNSIAAPLLGHRFRLDFGGSVTLNRAVRSCDLKLIEKKLHVALTENRDGAVLPLLMGIVNKGTPFVTALDFMQTQTQEPVQTVYLHDLRLIEHKLSLSYVSNETAEHECIFEFSEITNK